MSSSSSLNPLTTPPRIGLFFSNFDTFTLYFSEYNLFYNYNICTKRSNSKFKSFSCKNKNCLFKLHACKRADNLIYITVFNTHICFHGKLFICFYI